MYDQYIRSNQNQMKDMGNMLNQNYMMNLMNPSLSNPDISAMSPTAMNMNNFMNNQLLNYIQSQNINKFYEQPVTVQAPIYDLNEVYLRREESVFESRRPNPNKKVKRANYHVGIAYHIYLCNM